MPDTKPCDCGCGYTITRKDAENNWNWKRRRYFDVVMCKRRVQVKLAKERRIENGIADENSRKSLVGTSEFWQAYLCGRLDAN